MAEEETKEPNYDRKGFILTCDLDPGTLCGSWFCKFENDEIVSWGIVVGEPQAGTYLVQFHQGLGSSDWYQQLVPIEQMTGEQEGEWKIEWRFFDQESQMTEAYASHVAKAER